MTNMTNESAAVFVVLGLTIGFVTGMWWQRRLDKWLKR